MRLLATAPSIRPPSASASSSSSASTPGSVSTSSYYPSLSLSSKSIGPDNLNNSHRSLSFAPAPGGPVSVSSPPSARLLPPSQGTNGAGVVDDTGGGGGSSVPPPISVAVGPRPRSSSWSFLSAGVEKLARDDDEAILWLIYGDDSCSSNSGDGMTNGDGPIDDKDSNHGHGSDGSDHGVLLHHPNNNNSGNGSGRYLYVEYLDWMDPDGAILGVANPHPSTTTTTAHGGGYPTSRSSSNSTTIGGGGYSTNGYHSEKETPLSSPLASASSLSSRVRDLGGGGFASMGNEDASMANSSPETPIGGGGGGNGASSSSLQDMGEIKVPYPINTSPFTAM